MKLREQKGITLIALVITIVVLLILAAVSFQAIMGDEGLLNKVSNAKTETRGGSVADKVAIWKADSKQNKWLNTGVQTEEEFLQSLKEEGLVFDEEIDSENKTITIGSRVIELYDEKIITFKIDGIEYKAEDEMTWQEWSESKYRAESTIIDSYDYVWVNGGCVRYSSGGTNYVRGNSKILKLHEYQLVRPVAECVYPNSNILASIDGETILAQDIKENDDIVYFDFKEAIVKTGKVLKVYVHKDATSFVKYIFEDGSYLEATDYHPIYTKEGWKSQTNRNGYEAPKVGDYVKTESGWKKITKIDVYTGKEDCYDFKIVSKDGGVVNNYFANGTLVQGSY